MVKGREGLLLEPVEKGWGEADKGWKKDITGKQPLKIRISISIMNS